MGKAIRSDCLKAAKWATFLRGRRNAGDAVMSQKCSDCDVTYEILIGLADDSERVVRLLKGCLPKRCPEHEVEYYIVDENPYHGRVHEEQSS
jgi:hypothetical protein